MYPYLYLVYGEEEEEGGMGIVSLGPFSLFDPTLGTGMMGLVRHSPALTPSSFLPSLMPQSCSFWLLGCREEGEGGGLFTAACLTT